MKKYFYLITTSIIIISLMLLRLGYPGNLLLIIGAVALIIGYLVKAFQGIMLTDHSIFQKYLTITTPFYIVLTLIGILSRHLWWNFPFYNLIFKFIWPFLTLGLVIQIIFYSIVPFGKDKETHKKEFIKDTLFPLLVILIIALSTFFTSTEMFCKIYKSYTVEELYIKWESEKRI